MDTLEIGYIAIGITVFVSSLLFARVKHLPLQIVLTVFAPLVWVLLCSICAWWPHLFRPLRFGEDDWKPWAIVAAYLWTLFAFPLQIVFVLLFRWIVKKRAEAT